MLLLNFLITTYGELKTPHNSLDPKYQTESSK